MAKNLIWLILITCFLCVDLSAMDLKLKQAQQKFVPLTEPLQKNLVRLIHLESIPNKTRAAAIFSDRLRDNFLRNAWKNNTLGSLSNDLVLRVDCSAQTLKIIAHIRNQLEKLSQQEILPQEQVEAAVPVTIDKKTAEEIIVHLKMLNLTDLYMRLTVETVQKRAQLRSYSDAFFYSLLPEAVESHRQSISMSDGAELQQSFLGAFRKKATGETQEAYDIVKNFYSQLYPQVALQQASVYNVLKEFHGQKKNTSVMDTDSWQDLNVLCGPNAHKAISVASQLARCSTRMGKTLFSLGLVSPIDNCDVLHKQIERIKVLHEYLSRRCEIKEYKGTWLDFYNELFSELQKVEPALLSLANEHDPLTYIVNEQKIKLERWPKLEKWLTTNSYAVQLCETSVSDCQLIIHNTFKTVTIPFRVLFGDESHPQLTDKRTMLEYFLDRFKDFFELAKKPVGTVVSIVGGVALSINPEQFSRMASSALMAGLLNESLCYDTLEKVIAMRAAIQQKLMTIGKFVQLMGRLDQALSYCPLMKEFFPALSHLNAFASEEYGLFYSLYKNTQQKITDFCCPGQLNHLIDNLKGTFATTFSGKLNATYRLMNEHKQVFFASLAAVGELEAQISVVRLMKEWQSDKMPYCFPSYSKEKRGSLDMMNGWNPTMKAEQIKHFYTLNLGCNGQPANALITGPNACGKSTFMRTLLFSIMLAQTYGIAPASHFCITPFAVIRAYLNQTDKPLDDLSLFQASAQRAGVLYHDADDANAHEKPSIVFYDELFNGTRPEMGESLAYGTLYELAQLKHSLAVASTHFNFVRTLQEEIGNSFQFLRVSQGAHDEERYVLYKGIYTSTNALEEAQKAGIPEAILARAEEYYRRLPASLFQRYKKHRELKAQAQPATQDVIKPMSDEELKRDAYSQKRNTFLKLLSEEQPQSHRVFADMQHPLFLCERKEQIDCLTAQQRESCQEMLLSYHVLLLERFAGLLDKLISHVDDLFPQNINSLFMSGKKISMHPWLQSYKQKINAVGIDKDMLSETLMRAKELKQECVNHRDILCCLTAEQINMLIDVCKCQYLLSILSIAYGKQREQIPLIEQCYEERRARLCEARLRA